MKRVIDGVVYAECWECLTAYWDPQDEDTSFRGEDVTWTASPAGRPDIEKRGWAGWIAYELD